MITHSGKHLPALPSLALSLGITLMAMTLTGCGDEAQTAAPSQPPPAVTVTPVIEAAVSPTWERVGRTVAVDEVNLRARVEGFLEKRLFEEGSEVNAGDLLFVIEQAPYQAQVDQAAAALARARAALTNAQQDIKRMEPLYEKGVVTAEDFDAAVAAEREAQAGVKEAEANLTRARLNLGYTEIHAPLGGRIGRAAVSAGNLVGPDSGVLATIVTLDPMYVTYTVSERDVMTLLQKSLEQENRFPERSEFIPALRLSNGSLYEYRGKLEFVDNRVDERTGTVTIRTSFPNPDKLLLPGQFVTVLIERDQPTRALLVPQAAVQQDQTGHFVLVVDDQNRVQTRRIEVGDQRGIDWIVEQGLEVGELVVYEGLQKVRPGLEVQTTVVTPDRAAGV